MGGAENHRMQAHLTLKNTIDFNMKKIEQDIQLQNMSLTQRVKRELIEQLGKKKVTDKDIKERVEEISRKNCSPSFQVTSRDRHQFIFRNKTNPPDVGKYSPNLASVE
jgi:Spy/CpxP family protein refolding chaperone